MRWKYEIIIGRFSSETPYSTCSFQLWSKFILKFYESLCRIYRYVKSKHEYHHFKMSSSEFRIPFLVVVWRRQEYCDAWQKTWWSFSTIVVMWRVDVCCQTFLWRVTACFIYFSRIACCFQHFPCMAKFAVLRSLRFRPRDIRAHIHTFGNTAIQWAGNSTVVSVIRYYLAEDVMAERHWTGSWLRVFRLGLSASKKLVRSSCNVWSIEKEIYCAKASIYLICWAQELVSSSWQLTKSKGAFYVM